MTEHSGDSRGSRGPGILAELILNPRLVDKTLPVVRFILRVVSKVTCLHTTPTSVSRVELYGTSSGGVSLGKSQVLNLESELSVSMSCSISLLIESDRTNVLCHTSSLNTLGAQFSGQHSTRKLLAWCRCEKTVRSG